MRFLRLDTDSIPKNHVSRPKAQLWKYPRWGGPDISPIWDLEKYPPLRGSSYKLSEVKLFFPEPLVLFCPVEGKSWFWQGYRTQHVETGTGHIETRWCTKKIGHAATGRWLSRRKLLEKDGLWIQCCMWTSTVMVYRYPVLVLLLPLLPLLLLLLLLYCYYSIRDCFWWPFVNLK